MIPEVRSVTVPRLSPREAQVIAEVEQGKANKIIAYELGLTLGTVKVHLTRIMRKCNVSNRTELAIWAIHQHQEQPGA